MPDRRWVTALFVLAIAVSSASLFVLQPMCARMVLPHLGGSPSVWTTCMLFFQAGLLGGYVYAHASGWIGLRAHAILHLVLLALAFAFLPPALEKFALPDGSHSPVLWLLGTLLTSIGLPCLVLASSAPLLQVWFARGDHAPQREPYFLYAASNAGSLLGLVAYPFLLEPFLSLRQQSHLWSGCFALFALLTGGCAIVAWRRPLTMPARVRATVPAAAKEKPRKARALTYGTLAKWLFLAFLPSSLLLSVTVHVTADLASVPFLWVVPLGIYLLTYILAFSPRAGRNQWFWLRWLPLVVLLLVIVLLTEATEPLLLILFLHLAGLFWIGIACHGELAHSRPPVAHLTRFYLCIAVGGALGGIFNALIAPAVFDSLVEYPAALVLACFIPALATSQPRSKRDPFPQFRKLDALLPAALLLITAFLAIMAQRLGVPAGPASIGLIFGVPLIICYTFSARPTRFGLGIAALLLASAFYPGVHGESEARLRSFFGIHRVTRDGSYRTLVHGNTEHGRQSLDPARRSEPLAYYARSGPIGDLFGKLPPDDPRLRRVAVLGLGAGALAAYAQPGQNWDFYEIDPSVAWVARHSGYFTYLQDAQRRGAGIKVVQGDARFKLRRGGDEYGLIILDAFGSDSIPTHLFTREALEVYRERLTEQGMLAINYSSRYFDLRPVLGNLAVSVQPPMPAISRDDLSLTGAQRTAGTLPSRWALLFQSSADPILPALRSAGWKAIQPAGSPWTDDRANVFRALQLSSP